MPHILLKKSKALQFDKHSSVILFINKNSDGQSYSHKFLLLDEMVVPSGQFL